MQLIVVFVLVAVILGLAGTGFLAQPQNNINLFVQALGFGEANLVSPVDNASIELMLDTVPSGNPEQPLTTIVSACGFRSQDIIPLGTGKAEGKIVCKLLNEAGNAIAEGDIRFLSYDPAINTTLVIVPINQPAFLGATNFNNVFNATVIIQGPL